MINHFSMYNNHYFKLSVFRKRMTARVDTKSVHKFPCQYNPAKEETYPCENSDIYKQIKDELSLQISELVEDISNLRRRENEERERKNIFCTRMIDAFTKYMEV